ncbi:MAG: hypothetical protein H5T44_00960 [Thermoplasmatales archaeon]|nr:hypothetical protein [Thermoplasmatales archaeon]
MLIVVDANRIFSALLSKGKAFDIFLLNYILRKFDFIAPEYLFYEIGKHVGEIAKRSKLSKEELGQIFEFMRQQITIIPFKEFVEYREKAKEIAPHNKDIPYFALALSLNAGIWSDEKVFKKQNKVKIFSTEELKKILYE